MHDPWGAEHHVFFPNHRNNRHIRYCKAGLHTLKSRIVIGFRSGFDSFQGFSEKIFYFPYIQFAHKVHRERDALTNIIFDIIFCIE